MGFGKRITLDEAKALTGFEWMLIYRSEKIELISWNEADQADKDKLFCKDAYTEDENLEVRAFSREKELHIFLTDDEPVAVYTEFGAGKNTEEVSTAVHRGFEDVNKEEGAAALQTDSGVDEYMEEKYKLDKRFWVSCGGDKQKSKSDDKKKITLIVRKLLALDEDGQAYVKQTCLAGLEVRYGE